MNWHPMPQLAHLNGSICLSFLAGSFAKAALPHNWQTSASPVWQGSHTRWPFPTQECTLFSKSSSTEAEVFWQTSQARTLAASVRNNSDVIVARLTVFISCA